MSRNHLNLTLTQPARVVDDVRVVVERTFGCWRLADVDLCVCGSGQLALDLLKPTTVWMIESSWENEGIRLAPAARCNPPSASRWCRCCWYRCCRLLLLLRLRSRSSLSVALAYALHRRGGRHMAPFSRQQTAVFAEECRLTHAFPAASRKVKPSLNF